MYEVGFYTHICCNNLVQIFQTKLNRSDKNIFFLIAPFGRSTKEEYSPSSTSSSRRRKSKYEHKCRIYPKTVIMFLPCILNTDEGSMRPEYLCWHEGVTPSPPCKYIWMCCTVRQQFLTGISWVYSRVQRFLNLNPLTPSGESCSDLAENVSMTSFHYLKNILFYTLIFYLALLKSY
jgi:hypothetical protein